MPARSASLAQTRSLLSALARYQTPSNSRAVRQILNSVLPYLGLWVVMGLLFPVSPWLALALTPLAAGLLVRIFIICHDCGHHSFVSSARVGDWVGFITGVLTLTPYFYWTHRHAIHHATAGNLDRRGSGDIWTMTLREYRAASWPRRLTYRTFRNPLVLFTVAPMFLFLIGHRFAHRGSGRRWHRSVAVANLAILAMGTAGCLLMGVKAYLMIQVAVMTLAAMGGVWLFYVQHQFDDAYWSPNKTWSYPDAALRGSSFYRLPGILRWFSGNIGFHHIHHLSPRIPNYALPRCHEETAAGLKFRMLGLRESLSCLRLRVFDEDRGRMVGLWPEFL